MKKSFFALLLLLIIQCSDKKPVNHYADYINDPANKIKQQIKIGDVQASIKWLPKQFRQMINNSDDHTGEKEQDNGLYYFDVKFEKIIGEKLAKEKMMYLNFDIQQDFVLLSGSDSILPAICQKIENGIGGSYEYMLAFEKPAGAEEDFTVIYNDKIFSIGTVAFVYDQNDIKKIPKIKR